MLSHPHIPCSRAFSLTEILVAIAIIAILASLLAPSLSKAVLRAQIGKSASNLRQIHTGLSLYEGENGRLPQATAAPAPSGTGTVTWDQALVDSGFLSNDPSIFKAPKDTIIRNNPKLKPRSYAVNDFVFYTTTSPLNGIEGRWVRSTRGAASVVTIFERPTNANTYGTAGSCAFHSPTPGAVWDAAPSPNFMYKTGANYLFGDGHVEFLDLRNYGSTPAAADLAMKNQLFTP